MPGLAAIEAAADLKAPEANSTDLRLQFPDSSACRNFFGISATAPLPLLLDLSPHRACRPCRPSASVADTCVPQAWISSNACYRA